MTMSVMMLNMAFVYQNANRLMHLPPSIDLSQKNATGWHEQMVTMKTASPCTTITTVLLIRAHARSLVRSKPLIIGSRHLYWSTYCGEALISMVY